MDLGGLIEFYNRENNFNVDNLLKISDELMYHLSSSASSIEDLFKKGNELFFPKASINGEYNLKDTQNVIFAFNHPTTFDIFPIYKLFLEDTNVKIINRLQNPQKYPSINSVQKRFDERFIFAQDIDKILNTLKNRGSIVMCPLLYLDSHLTPEVIESQVRKLIKLAKVNHSKIVFGKLKYDYMQVPFRNVSIEILESLNYTDMAKILKNSHYISK